MSEDSPNELRFQFGLRRFALSIALFAATAACGRWMAQLTRNPAFHPGWLVFVVGSVFMAALFTAAVSLLFRAGLWATLRAAIFGASIMFVLIVLLTVILAFGVMIIR